ncbi:DUF2213 domain-containing protein [Serratia ureilytica]
MITSAKITRAGPVEYYGHELGMTGKQLNQKFTVTRSLDELTQPDTLASFEGQTLTLTHPDSGAVDASEWKDKAIGHIQNVRSEGDYLVCDAYIKDAAAIAVLKDTGARELSCGFEPATLVERNGQIHQIDIRGNHVAVVAKGRLGADVRLNDKKGKPMKKFTLKDAIALLKGKRVNDGEGGALTEEELIGMIAALEATLADLEGRTDEETLKTAQEVTDKLAELKAQLEAVKTGTVTPTDAEGDTETDGDDKDLRIAALEKENAELKQQVADLQDELAKLKGEQEASSVLNDAKARFPKVDVTKAKSAREIRERVLTHSGAFNDAAVKSMSDAEIRAAYAAAQALNKPRASKLGDILLGDSKPVAKKTAAQRFGGK